MKCLQSTLTMQTGGPRSPLKMLFFWILRGSQDLTVDKINDWRS